MNQKAHTSDIAIEVKNLSKCYQIYNKPQDRLLQMLARGYKRFYREFWALKGVSLQVKRGEVIGIIGRNGSGKSTLLQLICGTLNPTQGSIQTNGRIAALLELGSGFNPQFTGRENVYMNGALFGMSRDEINERFEDIANFADIGDFIEQPVKTYSSGMMVRLAFSVAIHVKPDILVVDEALSVGDIAFRNKCLEYIHKLILRGATILFVTHDLSTLQLICSRVFWLEHGQVKASGDPVKISQDYYVHMQGYNVSKSSPLIEIPSQQETGKALFTNLQIIGGKGNRFSLGTSLRISFSLLAKESLGPMVFAVSIYRADGDWIIGQTSREAEVIWPAAKAGETRKGSLQMNALCLAPGNYLVAFGAYSADYSLCYALTDLSLNFSVNATFPTWGKFIHPCQWLQEEA